MAFLLGTILVPSVKEPFYSGRDATLSSCPGFWIRFPPPLLKASSSLNMLPTFETAFVNVFHREIFSAFQSSRNKYMAFLKVTVLSLTFTLPWKSSGRNWIIIILLLPILVRPRNTTSRILSLDSWKDWMNVFLLYVPKSCFWIPFRRSIEFSPWWFNRNVSSVSFLLPLLNPIALSMLPTILVKVVVCLVRRPPTKTLPIKSSLTATTPDTLLMFVGGSTIIHRVTLATLAAHGSKTVTPLLLPIALLQSTQWRDQLLLQVLLLWPKPIINL